MESANMKNYAKGKRNRFDNVITSGQEHLISEYFYNLITKYDDVLTAQDIADITGINKKSLMKLLKSGHIKSLTSSPRYIIPKQYFLDFTTTKRFRDITTSSKRFVNLIDGFETWKRQHHASLYS